MSNNPFKFLDSYTKEDKEFMNHANRDLRFNVMRRELEQVVEFTIRDLEAEGNLTEAKRAEIHEDLKSNIDFI